MRIAPEGWPFIAAAWVLALVAGWLWWPLGILLGIVAAWVVAFFRDPIRPGPRGERYVLAAAEGHVVGTVELVHYNKGKFLHAGHEKASLDNEQSSIGLRGPRGRVLVRQIAGLIARRIVTDARPGDRVTQGDRLGLIRFGSRTDVFLPLSARPVVKVKLGDRVRVGGTVLAEYA